MSLFGLWKSCVAKSGRLYSTASNDLDFKSILVTGAGHPIGRSVCKSLAELGCTVIAVDQESEELDNLKFEHPCVELIELDLADWRQSRGKLCDAIKGRRLHGLVHNSGNVAICKPFMLLRESDLEDTFKWNFRTIFNVSQLLVPRLCDQSSIVMVSAATTQRSIAGQAAYAASKSAADSLTRSLAVELAPQQIRVNSVQPFGGTGPQVPLERTPWKRSTEIDEVVQVILFLLSAKSSFVNGQHLRVDGGYTVT